MEAARGAVENQRAILDKLKHAEGVVNVIQTVLGGISDVSGHLYRTSVDANAPSVSDFPCGWSMFRGSEVVVRCE